MSVVSYSEDWRALQKYATMLPEHFYLMAAIGEGAYLDGNYTLALKFYKKALALRTDQNMEWSHIAYTFEEGEKNYDKAILYYEKARKLATQNEKWLMQRLGWSYIQQKSYEKALQVFLEHCQHDPLDSWSHGKVGYCYQMLENYEGALDYHLRADKLGSTENAWNLGNIGYWRIWAIRIYDFSYCLISDNWGIVIKIDCSLIADDCAYRQVGF